MRPFTYVALFAGAAVAETAVVLLLLPLTPLTALRIEGSDNGVTTYVNECPAGKGGLPPLSSSKGK
jgi:hypothetical protein